VKRIGLLALSLILSAQLFAGDTTTAMNFVPTVSAPADDGTENEFGETIGYLDATISTSDFKVDNFWEKFRDDGNGAAQSTYDTVQKVGTFKLLTQSTFGCAKSGLPEEGCSGQKPFLINQSVLTNESLKVDIDGKPFIDADGNKIGNIYRIPFNDEADFYDENGSMNIDAFYALNVKRAGEHYDGGGEPEDPEAKRFWQRLVDMFKDYYSYDISTSGDALDSDEGHLMTRYIANIDDGLDEPHKIDKTKSTEVNKNLSANQMRLIEDNEISLLTYNQSLLETNDGCKGFLLSYDPDSFRCKMMRRLGTASWMPFWNSDTSYDIKTTSVVKDTEATLLKLAGELDKTNYITDTNKGENNSFLKELIKPMTHMMSGMFRFWFGTKPKVAESVTAVYTFKNPMSLDFITTVAGATADGFAHFKLLALESTYGTEITECTLKYKNPSFLPAFMIKEKQATFFADIDAGDTSINLISGAGWAKNDYPALESSLTYEKKYFGFSSYYEWTVTKDAVFNWCRRHSGDGKDGLFTRIFKSFFTWINPTTTDTYEGQLDELFDDNSAYVEEYKEKVHRGLILKLQEEKIELGQAGTTTTYKLMNVN